MPRVRGTRSFRIGWHAQNGLGLWSAAGWVMVRVVGPWREALALGGWTISSMWHSTASLVPEAPVIGASLLFVPLGACRLRSRVKAYLALLGCVETRIRCVSYYVKIYRAAPLEEGVHEHEVILYQVGFHAPSHVEAAWTWLSHNIHRGFGNPNMFPGFPDWSNTQ